MKSKNKQILKVTALYVIWNLKSVKCPASISENPVPLLKDSKILRNFKNSNLRAGLGINGGAILSRGAPFFPINCTFGDGYGLAFVFKYERAPGTDQSEIKINYSFDEKNREIFKSKKKSSLLKLFRLFINLFMSSYTLFWDAILR